MEAVERHRANEGGFRFETSAQLKEVEDERIRLEKERRVSTFSLDNCMCENFVNNDCTAHVGAALKPESACPKNTSYLRDSTGLFRGVRSHVLRSRRSGNDV